MQRSNLNKYLGVIGGGQLGKMIGLAAANLGIKSCFYDPDPDAPAKNISTLFFNEKYDNKIKLLEFANKCDFITYEFENIPMDCLKAVRKKKKIYPGIKALQISQDRHLEKSFITNLGIKVVKYENIKNFYDIENFLKKNTKKGILKTRKLGYDGKGQVRIELSNLQKINFHIKPNNYIIEELVRFKKEISVIAIREKNGRIKTFEPSENYHKHGILRKTIFPASISKNCASKAKKIAEKIIDSLDIVGILAIEMFVLKDEDIIVNEIAPRPHNSGHWTIDGCNLSQFDVLVRTIYNMPIPKIIYKRKCKMINLLGENFNEYKKYLSKKNHRVYIYGKTKIKKERKMGHVNIID